jgi:hypothetical protein
VLNRVRRHIAAVLTGHGQNCLSVKAAFKLRVIDRRVGIDQESHGFQSAVDPVDPGAGRAAMSHSPDPVEPLVPSQEPSLSWLELLARNPKLAEAARRD